MTAQQILARAIDIDSDARLQAFNAVCGRRGCQQEPLEQDARKSNGESVKKLILVS